MVIQYKGPSLLPFHLLFIQQFRGDAVSDFSIELTSARARFSGSDGSKNACNAGDLSSIPGSGRSPGGGQGNPVQYSFSGEFHGQRRLAGYSPWGCKESDTTE